MLKFIDNDRGVMAIEMAIVGPILLTLMLGIFYFGFLIKNIIQMQNAVEAGALYAINKSTDTAGIQSVVQNATTLTGITVTITTYCECANGTRPACTGSCADLSSLAAYTQIQGQKSVALPVKFAGMTNPYVVTETATMRTG